MYAIVENGGKQLKVREGDTVLVDKLGLTPGEEVAFEKVLFYSDEVEDVRVGTPLLSTVAVTGTASGSAAGRKLTVFKFRKRKSSQCKTGHRQKYTQVRIESIKAS